MLVKGKHQQGQIYSISSQNATAILARFTIVGRKLAMGTGRADNDDLSTTDLDGLLYIGLQVIIFSLIEQTFSNALMPIDNTASVRTWR
jgi:hypothetical protein